MKIQKALMIILTVLLAWGSTSWASPHQTNEKYSKEYGFSFTFGAKEFRTLVKSESPDEAFQVAADQCFNYFTGSKGQDRVQIPEELGLDIIDVCANPRAI